MPGVLEFLERDPVMNVYAISKFLDEGFEGPGEHLAVLHEREIVCVASIGMNVLLCSQRDVSNSVREIAVGIVADQINQSAHPPRAIVSEASLVDSLWQKIRTRVDPPTVVRLHQPVYVLDGLDHGGDLAEVRYSTLQDLDQLVPACAAMHHEEVGINPLERDAFGYRQRIRELILRKRSLIFRSGRDIAFKTEFSAVTPQAVQLMGVWTHPKHRRKGIARTSLREICAHLLAQRKRVTLFVNDFNLPALTLYESLGFRRVGTNRALIW